MVCRAFPNEIPEALAYCSEDLMKQSGHPGVVDMPRWIDTWRAYYESGSGILFMDSRVSEGIGGVLGALYFTDPATGMKKAAELLYYVHPGHRGRGIGTRLYREFADEAIRRGTRALVVSKLCDGGDGSQALERLWLREGFKPLETVYIKDLWDGQEQ